MNAVGNPSGHQQDESRAQRQVKAQGTEIARIINGKGRAALFFEEAHIPEISDRPEAGDPGNGRQDGPQHDHKLDFFNDGIKAQKTKTVCLLGQTVL